MLWYTWCALKKYFLKDYLSNRKQYVVFNQTLFSVKDVTCGVLQGSILGPSLIVLYINYIVYASRIFHFILFADDTNLFCSDSDLVEPSTIVNNELIKLCDCFQANILSKKTNLEI